MFQETKARGQPRPSSKGFNDRATTDGSVDLIGGGNWMKLLGDVDDVDVRLQHAMCGGDRHHQSLQSGPLSLDFASYGTPEFERRVRAVDLVEDHKIRSGIS
jgi:hypothetical protein